MALEHLGFPFTGPLSTHTFNIDISRHPGLRSFFPPPPPTMHSHWEPVGRSRSASHHCNLARAPSPVALSSHFQLCLETTPPRHPPIPTPGILKALLALKEKSVSSLLTHYPPQPASWLVIATRPGVLPSAFAFHFSYSANHRIPLILSAKPLLNLNCLVHWAAVIYYSFFLQ